MGKSNKMISVKQAMPKKMKAKKLQKPAKVEKKVKSKPVKEIATKLLSEENQIAREPQSLVNDIKQKNKTKYVMPSKSITEKLVNLSLNALQQLTVHYKKKNTIFEDETPIFAEINCIKIQNTKGNVKFVLPHTTVASTGEVCLITPDLKKGKKIDHEPTVDHWEELLRNAGVTAVKTVIPMRQLRVEYDQYELKRRLLTQHDFIMVDSRILSHVSHILGKMFFKKHNMLIPVRINEKTSLKKDIDVGLRTAMLRLSEGATSTIIVGHTGMPQKAVKENILSLVQQFHTKFPGGEANIRSIALKLPLSLALPLYVTLRPSNTVVPPKLHHQKPKNFTVLEDELSTIPGSTVRVAPDGTVHVKRGPVNDIGDMEEDDEEENGEEVSSDEEALEKEED
ncbi:ribosomal L1 domain-containing protein CG13096-like [Pectinophora gossypiella]|uniref:ribosomal L1 domain-containing protein CG13096-like n=1 Tax=Pectinophora gossypiella TaxID=13191 RepID=UPI00214EE592|nr:ribosomal L1 domain-containing protein CG13096-like [Pectinophora gossypiella]